MLFTNSNSLFSMAKTNVTVKKLVQMVVGKTAETNTNDIFYRDAFYASIEAGKAEIKDREMREKELEENIGDLKHNLGQAKGDDLRSKFEEQIQAHKDTYDANNKEISQLKERILLYEKEISSLNYRLRSAEEDFTITRRLMEDAQLTVESQLVRLKTADKEGSYYKEQYHEIKADKQKQKEDFAALQTRAVKMGNSLRTLASNITSYLEENKLMKKKLDRVEKRHELGLHDMTPRPNYKEIFARRGFTHFKDDLGLKIIQQQYSSSEVVEELIDMIKALEVKKHFSNGMLIGKSIDNHSSNPRRARRKNDSIHDYGLNNLDRPMLLGSRRDMRPLDAGAQTPRSANRSRLNVPLPPPRADADTSRMTQNDSPPNSSPESSSKSSDVDSQVSELSDHNYKLIRNLEQDMEGIKKGFSDLVQI